MSTHLLSADGRWYFPTHADESVELDMAFLLLSPSREDEIGKCSDPIPESAVCAGPVPSGSRVLVLGYPYSKRTVLRDKRAIGVRPFPIVSRASDRHSGDVGATATLQLPYHRVDKQNPQRRFGPKLNGMSGCGIWVLGHDEQTSASPVDLRLGAILVSYSSDTGTIDSAEVYWPWKSILKRIRTEMSKAQD